MSARDHLGRSIKALRAVSPTGARFVRDVARGRVGLADAVRAVHGGGPKWAAAILRGEARTEADMADCLATCAACPSRQQSGGSDWCGPPYTGSTAPPTCGCSILVVCTVSTKKCPQGKF